MVGAGRNFVLVGALFLIAALIFYLTGNGGVYALGCLALGIAFLGFGLVKRRDRG